MNPESFHNPEAPKPADTNTDKGLLGRAGKFARSKFGLAATVLAATFAPMHHADAKGGKGSEGPYIEGSHKDTKKASKELLELYKESKDFLQHYYESDYFRAKTIYPQDSSEILSQMVAEQYPEIGNKIFALQDEDSLKKNHLKDVLGKNYDPEKFTTLAIDEIENELDSLYKEGNRISDSFAKTKSYPRRLDSMTHEMQAGYLNELNRDIPLKITSKKNKRIHEDGHHRYDPEGNNEEIFVSKKDDDSLNITTPVHELTHKATVYLLINFSRNSMDALEQEAFDNIEANKDTLLIRHPNLEKDAVYFADPTEIIARMSSARFWLHKHDTAYDATKPFTEKDWDVLDKNFSNLPYDIQQLMDVFPYKEKFIKNMNTY